MCRIIFHFFRFHYSEMRRKLWPKAPAKVDALGQMSKNFQVQVQEPKSYTAMLLYLFFDSLLSTSSKKMETEKWPKAADSPLPLESVNLFLHVFLCLEVILTIEHYIKLLTIFIWKFAIFWSWQLALWNLGQLAPSSFFYLQQAHGRHVWDIYVVD